MPAVVNVLVRPAVEDDLDGVIAVGHRTWPPTYEPIAGADFVAMGLAKWWSAEATRPLIAGGRVTVAEVDGTVVGVAAAGPHEGRLVLWKLYVLPEYQHRGIGARLLESVVEDARDLYPEIRLAYLDGSVAARDFYVHKGFVEVEREPGSGGLPDNIWMSRPVAVG
ncbi:MAG: GNAT family N-acetyltransferase [Lapillicoccus sp.]